MAISDAIGKGMSEQEKRNFGNWLAGFTDGEGCFHLAASKLGKLGQQMSACFSINLRDDDTSILCKIRDFLGCGKVFYHKSRTKGVMPQAVLRVDNVDDNLGSVVPTFEQYVLRAKKRSDFLLWKEAVKLLAEVKSRPRISKGGFGTGHLPKWKEEEVAKYVSFRDDLIAIRQYKPVPIRTIIRKHISSELADWVTGLVDGEGFFCLSHRVQEGYWRPLLSFGIGLRSDDVIALQNVQRYFGCGSVSIGKVGKIGHPLSRYSVTGVENLLGYIVSHFNKYPLRTKKLRDFLVWSEAVSMANQIKLQGFKSKAISGKRGGGGLCLKWDENKKSKFIALSDKLREGRKYIAVEELVKDA